MNISEMSLDELLALQSEVKQGLEKQKDSAILDIVATMKAMNIGIDEVAKFMVAPIPIKETNKRKPKYYNPANSLETWGGIGKMPKWFKEQLEKGTDKESMLISA